MYPEVTEAFSTQLSSLPVTTGITLNDYTSTHSLFEAIGALENCIPQNSSRLYLLLKSKATPTFSMFLPAGLHLLVPKSVWFPAAADKAPPPGGLQ